MIQGRLMRMGFARLTGSEGAPTLAGLPEIDREKEVNTMKLNARSKKICFMVGLVAALGAWPLMSQEAGAEEAAAPEPNWKNEIGLSYVGTSGNTDTSALLSRIRAITSGLALSFGSNTAALANENMPLALADR